MSSGLRIGIQAILAIAIVGLAYFLYISITEPYEAIERAQEVTARTRGQMNGVRTALIAYERHEGRFPGSLDSLQMWVAQDSFAVAKRDSIFASLTLLNLDSLLFSPRTGKQFVYSLNDTGRVAIYLLKDPDSEDQIGSESPDVTQLNAASWE